MCLHSLKVAQLLRSAACLHTNQSRSYLNHLVQRIRIRTHLFRDIKQCHWGKPDLQKSISEFDIAEYQVSVRNATDKFVNRYVNLLLYQQRSLLHVSATYCGDLHEAVLRRMY